MYMQMYISLMAPKRYSIAEARAKLPAIVDATRAGHAVEITRRGKPVAAVISIKELEALRAKPSPFAEAYERFRRVHPQGDVGIERDFVEGLRPRGTGRKVRL
jgi:prevent-host-death family protein